LLAGRGDAERPAARTGIGATFIARKGRFELAIGGQKLAFDEAKAAEEGHHRGHGLLDRHGADAGAEVTEVILARDMVVQAGQFPVATPLLRLVEIATEAGIIDVLIHFGNHLQDDEARRVVTMATSGAVVGRTNRAGEAEVNRGTDKPTETAFDIALRR